MQTQRNHKPGSPFRRRPLMLVLVWTLGLSQAEAFEMPLKLSNGGGYYLSAPEAGQSGFLIDTGARYVTLTSATFSSLQTHTDARFQRNIVGVMADGKRSTVPIYRLQRLVLGPECVLRDIEVAVMKSADRDILGMADRR